MLARPSLPAGSSAAPPRKAMRTEMMGLIRSLTSQASTPPGLTTLCTSMASAGGAKWISARAARTRKAANIPG